MFNHLFVSRVKDDPIQETKEQTPQNKVRKRITPTVPTVLPTLTSTIASPFSQDEVEYVMPAIDDDYEPPDYIDVAIKAHFSRESNPCPEFLKEYTHQGMGQGLRAKERIEAHTLLGRYCGDVYYIPNQTDEAQNEHQDNGVEVTSDRFMDIKAWNWIRIDSVRHWSGLMNHKWKWPYADEIPYKFVPFFANATVHDNGEIYTLSTVNSGEAITIDYGLDYWTRIDIKPLWKLPDTDVAQFFGLHYNMQPLRGEMNIKQLYEHSTIVH